MSDLNRRMMNTPDLNKERLDILKEHLPDLFTADNQLNESELRKLIDAEHKESERFDFRWFGKTKAKRLAFTPMNKTLAFAAGRSVNPHLADGNLIIEGENLESLKVLLAAYREKIKCIYIDPPYNTGNDFIYKDKFNIDRTEHQQNIGDINKEGLKLNSNPDTSGHFHSDWLNMIYSRLLLSRQLLRDDGVIFISIDDKEVHNLRKLCDEIFGENNFIANMIRKNVAGGQNDTGALKIEYDYVLVFAKAENKLVLNKQTVNTELDKKYKYADKYLKRRGKYYLRELDYKGSKYSAKMDYPIILPNKQIIYAGGVQAPPKTWRWS